ncbi:MAG: DUF3943 domain-containing protein [Flavobacterium sp.]|nr:DUF3943 domain-containing protein [Flavobacterium sp.]
MIFKKTFLYSLLLIIICSFSNAQELDSIALKRQPNLHFADSSSVPINETRIITKDTVLNPTVQTPQQLQDSLANIFPPKTRDYRRLGYDSSIYLGAAVIGFGVLWVMPESATNWDKEQMREKGIMWKWKENVKAGPIWDTDNWVLNYVTHPYCGGLYYMTARSSGFSIFESFTYSAIMSTFFWEYGIEAFAEVPSTQDLIATPVLGSVVGEAFFYAKKSIVKHDKKVLKSRVLGITTLFFIDPFNTILDGFGYKQKVKTQMSVAPIGFDASSNKTVWGINFSASF